MLIIRTKPPRQNMMTSCTFRRALTLSLTSWKIGRMRIEKSVRMFRELQTTNTVSRSMHVPGTEGSHKELKGTHCVTTQTIWVMLYAIKIPPIM